MNHPTVLDIILLLATGVTAAYMVWRFWARYGWDPMAGTLWLGPHGGTLRWDNRDCTRMIAQQRLHNKDCIT